MCCTDTPIHKNTKISKDSIATYYSIFLASDRFTRVVVTGSRFRLAAWVESQLLPLPPHDTGQVDLFF